MKLLLMLIISLLVSSPAYAGFPLSSYNLFKNKQSFGDYLTGVGRGVFAANTLLEFQHLKPLLCAPDDFQFDRVNLLSIIDDEINHPSKVYKYPGDTPIELIVAIAIKNRFRCKNVRRAQ